MHFQSLFKVQKHGSKCPWKLAKIEQTGLAALTLASQAKLALLLRCTGTVGADCSYHLNSGFSWVMLLTCSMNLVQYILLVRFVKTYIMVKSDYQLNVKIRLNSGILIRNLL